MEAESNSNRLAPLSIALLINGKLSNWHADLVRRILETPGMRITLVVRNKAFPAIYKSRFEQFWKFRRVLVYWLFQRIDAKLHPVKLDAFADAANSDELLHGIPSISVMPQQTRFIDRFGEEDLDQIRQHEIDVALRFGFRILKGPVLDIARYGVWSFHNADNAVNRGGPGGFWEVINGVPEQGHILQVLNEKLDDGLVIRRSWSKTVSESVHRNRNNYFWKCPSVAISQLRRLANERDGYIEEIRAKGMQPLFYGADLYRPPENLQAIKSISKYLARKLASRLTRRRLSRKVFYKLGDDLTAELRSYNALPPPASSEWLFAQAFVNSSGQPSIIGVVDSVKPAMMELAFGKNGAPGKLAELPIEDFSGDPFRFVHEGQDCLLVPNQIGILQLYASRSGDWVHVAELADPGPVRRAVLLHKDGLFWLFASQAANQQMSADDETYLYQGKKPDGPFAPHRLNPVISDARCAAPAGAIFRYRDSWYRPGLDVTTGTIAIQRIEQLDSNEYRESNVQRVRPEWLGTRAELVCFSQADNIRVVCAVT